MKIGIDIMGGDYAPTETIKGVILSLPELADGDELVLVGDKEIINSMMQKEGISSNDFEIIHASETIPMAEHPTKGVSKYPDSSIVVGFKALKEGKIEAFASAGNTGAMLVSSIYTIKNIPGVIRPTISSLLPKVNGNFGIILDVGANSDCKPDILYQFGILGSLYAKHVFKIDNPKVGLLNIGEEEGKGNLLTQATYPLMNDTDKFNFIGNIEGRDLFNDKADIIVCDGFTGNIALKLAESIFEVIKHRNISDEYFDRFNYEDYGGTPILGISSPVVIGHGISNDKAFKSMIKLTKDLVDSDLVSVFKNVFN